MRQMTQIKTGILLPLYIYPQNWIPRNAWEQIAGLAKAHPDVEILAIINPDSGPGTSQNSDYVKALNTINFLSNIKVLGYTYTSYARREIIEAKKDIDRYIEYYSPNIDGIFFDEMANNIGNEIYYSHLSDYTKEKCGLTLTVGNPGTESRRSYIGTVDTIAIYEGESLPDIEKVLRGTWHNEYAKSNLAFYSYNIPSLDLSYVYQAAKYVGYLYITNGCLPNPWNILSSHLSNLLSTLESCDRSKYNQSMR